MMMVIVMVCIYRACSVRSRERREESVYKWNTERRTDRGRSMYTYNRRRGWMMRRDGEARLQSDWDWERLLRLS
jgi:hypothetical protein